MDVPTPPPSPPPLQYAAPPRRPSASAWLVVLSLAVAVGLALGAGLWYLRRVARVTATGPVTVLPTPGSPSPWTRTPNVREFPVLPSLSASGRAHRARCAENLRRIASALQSYANAHDWQYPDRLEDLVAAGLLPADALACPADESADDGSTSYLYTGKGLTFPLAPDVILLHERSPSRHAGEDDSAEGGMHVLLADGRARFVPESEAAPLLAAAASASSVPLTLPPATGPVAGALRDEQSDAR